MIMKLKPSSISKPTAISAIVLQENEFPCFFYFLYTQNFKRLAEHEMFDKYDEAQYYYCQIN